MTDETATKYLLAHFMHRMNEFLDQNKAEEIEEKELGERFARWLYVKDGYHEPFKMAEGVIAQHFNVEQIQDEGSFVMAQLKLFKDHGVGLLWMACLFNGEMPPLPDTLREMTVATLRYHADKLESRDIDARMKELVPKTSGAT